MQILSIPSERRDSEGRGRSIFATKYSIAPTKQIQRIGTPNSFSLIHSFCRTIHDFQGGKIDSLVLIPKWSIGQAAIGCATEPANRPRHRCIPMTLKPNAVSKGTVSTGQVPRFCAEAPSLFRRNCHCPNTQKDSGGRQKTVYKICSEKSFPSFPTFPTPIFVGSNRGTNGDSFGE